MMLNHLRTKNVRFLYIGYQQLITIPIEWLKLLVSQAKLKWQNLRNPVRMCVFLFAKSYT